MNVYRFSKGKNNFKIVIADNVGEAENSIKDFEFDYVKVLYKDVIVCNNNINKAL